MVTKYFENAIDVGIIGLGPRGLGVLERLIALSKAIKHRRIRIHVFEPKRLGCGAHAQDLPDHLLLNTIAGQMGIFPDAAALPTESEDVTEERRDFLSWCVQNEVSINDRGQRVEDHGRPVSFDDFLPRALLGDYLHDSFLYLAGNLPANVDLLVYQDEVEQVRRDYLKSAGPVHGFHIRGANGNSARVHALIVTTGHPIGSKLNVGVSKPSEAVVVEGLGLTAMDTLAQLSQGLGGEFIKRGAQFTYKPSGQEPKILVQSMSGLPFHSRPHTPLDRKRHVPVVMTLDRIQRMKDLAGDACLDFEAQILPAVLIEMRSAAFAVNQGRGSAKIVSNINRELRKIADRDMSSLNEIDEYLAKEEINFTPFDPISILETKLPSHVSPNDYQEWVYEWMRNDLIHTNEGLLNSPIKAALETWRDLRDSIRAAVDYGGLNPSSHRKFYGHWTGLINRLVAGPQKERSQDLLALIDAGVVTLVHPSVQIDASINRINARVPRFGLCGLNAGLFGDLKRQKKIRAVLAEPGFDAVEVNSNCQAIGYDGEPVRNLWLLGPMVEGASYYNHYVPAPGSPNRAMTDAHKVASSCLSYFGALSSGYATCS